MCPGDLPGDHGQGPIAGSLVFEAVFRHGDSMRAAMPVADESRTGLQAQAGRGADAARRPKALCNCLQLAAGRLAQASMRALLKLIAERQGKQVTAELRWGAAHESLPFETQIGDAERTDAIELTPDRSGVRAAHSQPVEGVTALRAAFDLAGLPASTR